MDGDVIPGLLYLLSSDSMFTQINLAPTQNYSIIIFILIILIVLKGILKRQALYTYSHYFCKTSKLQRAIFNLSPKGVRWWLSFFV